MNQLTQKRAVTFSFEPQLQYLHEELTRLCGFLNDLPTPPVLDPSDFEDALISLAYRFLYLWPLSRGALSDETENGYHVGAVALLWTIMFESGRLHRSPYTLLAKRLRDAVDKLLAAGTGANELVLWLLFLGGVSVLRSDDEWLHGRIKSCAAVLGLPDWHSAREVLRSLPWINLIHDKPAQRIWHIAKPYGRMLPQICSRVV